MPTQTPPPAPRTSGRASVLRRLLAAVVSAVLAVGAPLVIVAPAHAATIATEDFDDLTGWTVNFWSSSAGNAVASRGPGGGGSIMTTASFAGFENIEVSIRYRVENLSPGHAFFMVYNPGSGSVTPINRTTDTVGFVTETYALNSAADNDSSVQFSLGNVTPSPDPMPVIEVDSLTFTGDPIDTIDPTITVVAPTDGTQIDYASPTSYLVEVDDNASAAGDVDVEYSFHAGGNSYSVTPTTGGSANERTASVAPINFDASLGLSQGDPFEWRITATDAEGNDAVTSVDLVFGEPVAPELYTTSLPDGELGEAYTFTVDADGTSPIVYSATGLPDGLEIDASTGVISGTPTEAGTFTVTIEATNGAGSDDVTLDLFIAEAPSITTTTLPDGLVGAAYSGSIAADGDEPLSFTATGLPPGIVLDETTGALSGEPTTAGEYTPEFTATNDAGSDVETIGIVVLQAPSISSGAPPSGVVGSVYEHTFTADGYPAPTFSVDSADLPPGLELDATSGVLDGAPTTAGSFTFTVTATNGAGSDDTAEYTIVIDPAPAAPAFTSGMPSDGAVGYFYSFDLSASGHPEPTFSVSGGDLPPGLTLDGATGVISGTPTTAGEFTLTLQASNGVGSPASLPVTIEILAPPVIGPGDPPAAVLGEPYSYVIPVAGSGPFTFTIALGALPPGLELDETTGEISGTPEFEGTSPVFIQVTNETNLVDGVEYVFVVEAAAVLEEEEESEGGLGGEADAEELAVTGAEASGVVLMGLVLLVLGAGARLLRRASTA